MIPGNGIETRLIEKKEKLNHAFYLMIPGNGIETVRKRPT